LQPNFNANGTMEIGSCGRGEEVRRKAGFTKFLSDVQLAKHSMSSLLTVCSLGL
jgi:hypothetical protein